MCRVVDRCQHYPAAQEKGEAGRVVAQPMRSWQLGFQLQMLMCQRFRHCFQNLHHQLRRAFVPAAASRSFAPVHEKNREIVRKSVSRRWLSAFPTVAIKGGCCAPLQSGLQRTRRSRVWRPNWLR